MIQRSNYKHNTVGLQRTILLYRKKTDEEGPTCVRTWIICFMAEFVAASLRFLFYPRSSARTDFKQTQTHTDLKQALSQGTSSNRRNA